ncbi:TetR family transcriptional regulator C-terminal domain-containing protein [Actinophytocola oryzae]|uniref:TetR family transcriptional regulator C-terminal domain-containing protein n=1 Tax=Actinophytocola oryzae TaxID=502181 RepID=UPI001AAE59DF|nr:TetR family transcriptional regulator C-terminal domain-containing protein [Actinophytocola oryzae]
MSISARLADRVAAGTADEQPISAIVLDGVLELLPLDDERRGEYRVTRVFRGRSLDNPALAEVAAATAADIRTQLATAVRNGEECGEVVAGTDADLAATRLAALVDGLADQLYDNPARRVGHRELPAAATTILRECLAATFTGQCHHYRTEKS